MPIEVVMPRLGWTMEVGRVVEWLKGDGETVEPGEFIFSVESDKAITEVEALDSGILRIPPDSPIGIEVPVGHTLAYIAGVGEEVMFPATTVPVPAAEAPPSTPSSIAPAPVESNGHATPPISPRARRLATSLQIDWSSITGSGSSGRIRERDIERAAMERAATPQPRATPLVRRLAEEAGFDLGQIATGRPGGRVTRADVAAMQTPRPQTGAPMSAVRRVIAQKMSESARTVAPVTLTTDADATELVRLREHLKIDLSTSGEVVPSFTDLLARIAALALLDHPGLNASIENDRIVIHEAVHIGIAVDTDRGLFAPVIRHAHLKSAMQIAAETIALIVSVRDGSAAADALTGSTFTISNLGMFDIDAFTPIVNLPEAAVLGLGRILAKPVVVDEGTETIAVRKMMALSLTFDHRIVDGAPAARFLQTIKQMIEHPYAPLMR